MSERLTRSQTGKTPKKPSNPGFVETPGRKLRSRKSVLPSRSDDGMSAEPEPFMKLEESVENLFKSAVLNGNGHMNGGTGLVNGNADTKEYANGHANGHTNGYANGSTDSHTNGKVESKTVPADHKVDKSGHFEFGGSLGVGAMMIGFPILMWYMWIGATYYDGGIPRPENGQSWSDFAKHCYSLVYNGAYPHRKAWLIYWTFFIMEGIFYCIMPGIYTWGKPLEHLGGKSLRYYCSGMWAWYTTIAIALTLNFTGLFKLSYLIEDFGSLMSVAILSGFIVAIVAYVSALARGAQHRMTGYPVYDFFMGAELNPRMFGILDFKMFFEVRIPWYILFLITLGAALKQYEEYGFVSGEVCFLLLAHFLYANACAKGEQYITTTWDMYYEKWGFMLIFWNLAGVPLSYCHCTLYLANHDPSEYHHSKWVIATLIPAYLFVYWVWDTCNSQKNHFRASEKGPVPQRRSFPQLPYRHVDNPVTIPTEVPGVSLFCDGWYGKARKVHYTCDLFFALCWAGITGFNSPFPWFYPLFFSGMIIHRALRDIQRCHERYGAAWEEYTRRVPYLFIPYVF